MDPSQAQRTVQHAPARHNKIRDPFSQDATPAARADSPPLDPQTGALLAPGSCPECHQGKAQVAVTSRPYRVCWRCAARLAAEHSAQVRDRLANRRPAGGTP